MIAHRLSTVVNADQIVVLERAASPSAERTKSCSTAADSTPIYGTARRPNAARRDCAKPRNNVAS